MWSQWPAFAPYNFLRNQNFKESLWVHISKNKRPTEWDISGALYVPTNYRNRKRQKEAQPTTKYSFFERLFSSLQLDWKNRIGARCWISGVNIAIWYRNAFEKYTNCIAMRMAKQTSLETENEPGKESFTTFNQNFGLKKFFLALLLRAFIPIEFCTTAIK